MASLLQSVHQLEGKDLPNCLAMCKDLCRLLVVHNDLDSYLREDAIVDVMMTILWLDDGQVLHQMANKLNSVFAPEKTLATLHLTPQAEARAALRLMLGKMIQQLNDKVVKESLFACQTKANLVEHPELEEFFRSPREFTFYSASRSCILRKLATILRRKNNTKKYGFKVEIELDEDKLAIYKPRSLYQENIGEIRAWMAKIAKLQKLRATVKPKLDEVVQKEASDDEVSILPTPKKPKIDVVQLSDED